MSIYKFIDNDLLFCMLIRNFCEWEYYVLNYLNQKKKFRALINKCFSKFTGKKVYNQKYYLDIDEELKINQTDEFNNILSFIYTKNRESSNILLSFK